MASRNHI